MKENNQAGLPDHAAIHGAGCARCSAKPSGESDRAAAKPLAISAVELARRLGISRAHLWKLNSSGRLPAPVRLGRSVRWDVATIEAWLAAGAPPRDEWAQVQSAEIGGR